ncbi:MAG: hypothetical protein R2736_16980 [Solirubrobacterales bacterium]
MRELTLLLDGGTFFEGARWRDGRWYVSDFYADRVIAVGSDGRAETVLEIAQPSGLGWLPDGALPAVSMRRCTRRASTCPTPDCRSAAPPPLRRPCGRLHRSSPAATAPSIGPLSRRLSPAATAPSIGPPSRRLSPAANPPTGSIAVAGLPDLCLVRETAPPIFGATAGQSGRQVAALAAIIEQPAPHHPEVWPCPS